MYTSVSMVCSVCWLCLFTVTVPIASDMIMWFDLVLLWTYFSWARAVLLSVCFSFFLVAQHVILQESGTYRVHFVGDRLLYDLIISQQTQLPIPTVNADTFVLFLPSDLDRFK